MRIFYKIALSIAIAMSAVGIVRARAKIGLQNLAYNIRRLVTLERIAAACPTPYSSGDECRCLAGQSGHAGQGAMWIAGDCLSTKVNSSLTRRR